MAANSQTLTLQKNANIFASKPSTTSTPARPTTERVRPYKDFLTPSFHRRFTGAALLILGACYITALCISPPSLLWIWNPVSFTGARALLLFMPCLAVFIVRVANLHVGRVTATSSAEESWRLLGKGGFTTVHTLGWYMYSAWFFGEVYIWSQGASANLGWVDQGSAYERPRMNENPIYLRSVFLCLAITQAVVHLLRGEDRLSVPERLQSEAEQKQQSASKLPNSIQQLFDRLPTLIRRTVTLAVPGAVFTTIVYFLFIRQPIWPYYYAVVRTFYRDLPPNARTSGLIHVMKLIWQVLSSTTLLTLLWELSSAAFDIFVSQAPLKREQPLTTEIKDAQGNAISKSKDPNGSLLSGMRSKKEVPKVFAFWELALITAEFPTRRKTIYVEVDRANGSTWAQVCKCCLDEIEAVTSRVKVFYGAANQSTEASDAAQTKSRQGSNPAQSRQQDFGMPRIADRRVSDDKDVFAKQKPDFVLTVGNAAKSFGRSPGAENPVTPRVRKGIEWGANRLLTKEEQARLSPQGLSREANGTLVKFLQMPIGFPFRKTFARRVRAVLFGTPLSAKLNIIHASRSLSTLCVMSLKEDDYGQVAKSIPTILRTYADTITTIDKFLAGLEPHWTDVFFRPDDRKDEEVDELLGVLKQGLEGILLAFGEYATALNITEKELREAQEAVGEGREMVKV